VKLSKKAIAILIGILVVSIGVGAYLFNDYINRWAITQYGGAKTDQSTFYTLQNKKGDLVVIDGGWDSQSDYVKAVINELGGHVDIWILSHPHPDHIEAFMATYKNPNEITIDNIYAVDMAAVELCQENAPWDTMATYEDFLLLNIPDLNYLYDGDKLEIAGLEIDILSAYSDNVDVLSNDLLNDGSLMFKVHGRTETMLFCSDIGISMSDYLINKYGDNLKSDYLQMGHHGYGGLSDEFYGLVKPKIAFFDAPDWLMFNESGYYDNQENAQLMRDMGSEIYSFSTAPNQIILK